MLHITVSGRNFCPERIVSNGGKRTLGGADSKQKGHRELEEMENMEMGLFYFICMFGT